MSVDVSVCSTWEWWVLVSGASLCMYGQQQSIMWAEYKIFIPLLTSSVSPDYFFPPESQTVKNKTTKSQADRQVDEKLERQKAKRPQVTGGKVIPVMLRASSSEVDGWMDC